MSQNKPDLVIENVTLTCYSNSKGAMLDISFFDKENKHIQTVLFDVINQDLFDRLQSLNKEFGKCQTQQQQ